MVPPDLARKLRRKRDRLAAEHADRDDLIRQAIDAGGSYREVADLIGLSKSAIAKIINRNR